MELNRNPENYFTDIEQAAFNPSNVVPGIGFSPDKMLQGRLFSYPDAHRYRIGTHYEALPVNQPKCPVAHYNRDGTMPFGLRTNPDAYYEPNSFDGPVEDPSVAEPPRRIAGEVGRYDLRGQRTTSRSPGRSSRSSTQARAAALLQHRRGDERRAGVSSSGSSAFSSASIPPTRPGCARRSRWPQARTTPASPPATPPSDMIPAATCVNSSVSTARLTPGPRTRGPRSASVVRKADHRIGPAVVRQRRRCHRPGSALNRARSARARSMRCLRRSSWASAVRA